MEQELNKYGFLSWGFIFDYLDRVSHICAISKIWECTTASANINYFIPITETYEFQFIFDSIWIMDNKCSITVSLVWEWKAYATASFLFIKRK